MTSLIKELINKIPHLRSSKTDLKIIKDHNQFHLAHLRKLQATNGQELWPANALLGMTGTNAFDMISQLALLSLAILKRSLCPKSVSTLDENIS